MITYKEIENRNGIKIYFYNENNILIATEENGNLTTHGELTEEQRKEIQEII